MPITGNSTRRGTRAALVALGVAGIAFNFWLTHAARSGNNADFDSFYAAGKLVVTGHLYDWDAIQALQRQHSTNNTLAFGRIPAVALAFKPISALPRKWAAVLWLSIGVGALGSFVALWPLADRLRALAVACWSFPAAMVLAFGQDTLLFLFFAALALWLLIRGFDRSAGMVLSLCLIKPHLAVLLPVWLVATRKWRAVWAAVAGVTAILLVSFAIEGIDWPKRFLALVPRLADAPLKMPTLRGLLWLVGGGLVPQIVLGFVILAALLYLGCRLDLTSGAALALAGGLLLSFHAYLYDAVLLLPALLVTWEGDDRPSLRMWSLLLFTPVPYLLLLAEKAWPAQLAVTGYTLTLFATELHRVWCGAQDNAPADGIFQRDTHRHLSRT